jgi:uncharacterized protein (TIGR02453 family)
MQVSAFDEQGVELLRRLPSMSLAEFKSHKKVYQNSLAVPAKAFVTSVLPALQNAVSPGIEGLARTNGSIAPINNDLRFSPQKPPYKDHLLFRFWEGPAKKTAATLFIRIAPDSVGFASGAAFNDVQHWRDGVNAAGADLVAALQTLGASRSIDIVGESLKRVPAPYESTHEHADLLRHKSFQVRWSNTTIDPTMPALIDVVARELSHATRVHAWLVKHLTETNRGDLS